MSTARLSPIDQANLLAGHAVSCATGYLDGRHDAQQLADNADRLFLDLLVVESEDTSAFLIPVQLLAFTMMRTARHAARVVASPGAVLSMPGPIDAETAKRLKRDWDNQKLSSEVRLLTVDPSPSEARLERWHSVMASLVDLVMHDSRQLKKD
jgi:hypothetical protein